MPANFLYALNQFFHNVLVVAFVGGSLYVVLLIRERRSGEGADAVDDGTEAFLRKQPRRGFWILVTLMATGANFGVLSLSPCTASCLTSHSSPGAPSGARSFSGSSVWESFGISGRGSFPRWRCSRSGREAGDGVGVARRKRDDSLERP